MKTDKITELIRKSGNDFHLVIADFLESKGWIVSISPYFNDPATGKPREIDIIANKEIQVRDEYYGQKGILKIQLFIECKYVNSNLLVWKRPKNITKAEDMVKGIYLLKGLHFDRNTQPFHHYLLPNEVIKLGAKEGKTDVIYEGMNGSLNALIFFRENYNNSFYTINYPIIVVNSFDKVFNRNIKEKNGYKVVEENQQLEIDYSFLDKDSKSKTEYFLLDIVSQDKLENFLKIIEENDLVLLRMGLREKLFNRGQNLSRSKRSNDQTYW